MANENERDPALDRIVLRGKLSEMARVPAWVEGVADRHAVDDATRFAINLCLEEAVSNVIRHGYSGMAEPADVVVELTELRKGALVFTVADSAPRFNPLDAPERALLDEQGQMVIGGRGIGLMRGFADSLEYEPTATGNRLRIGFSNASNTKPQSG
jgi:anti-sigma regulatory factor (Ser/Thr protein kinase)